MIRETVSIRIDPEVWQQSKVRAAELGMSIGRFTEGGLLRILRDTGKKKVTP